MLKRVSQTPRYPGNSHPQGDESIPGGAVVLPQDGTTDEAVRMSTWVAMRTEVYKFVKIRKARGSLILAQ